MTLQKDALKSVELDQQICRTIIAGNTNELGCLLKKYARLRDSLKLEMLGKLVISAEDSKTSDALRKIVDSDGLPSDTVVQQILKLGGDNSPAEIFGELEFEQLGSKYLYSWISHYEYISALAEMRPMILRRDPSESVRRLVNQVKGCYAFQLYDAAYGLCRTLLEASVYDICRRCNSASESVEKFKWETQHKKISSGSLRKRLRDLYRRLSDVLHASKTVTSGEALAVFRETLLLIEELYDNNEFQ